MQMFRIGLFVLWEKILLNKKVLWSKTLLLRVGNTWIIRKVLWSKTLLLQVGNTWIIIRVFFLMQQMFPIGICVVGKKKNILNKKVLWRKMLNEYKFLCVVRYHHQLNKKSAKWTLSIGTWFMGKHLKKNLWSRRQLNKNLWSRLCCIWICENWGFLWKSNNYVCTMML